jgi:hypothetical protein
MKTSKIISIKCFAGLALIMLYSSTVFSQSDLGHKELQQGSNIIQLGFGPGRNIHGGNTGPSFRFTYEHAVFQAGPGLITLGMIAGHGFNNYKYKIGNDTYKGRWSSTSIGFRSAWHAGWGVKHLDTYAGFASGVRFDGYSVDRSGEPKPDYHPANFYFGVFLGGVWYFTDNFGFFAEGGYDLGVASIGVNFKF